MQGNFQEFFFFLLLLKNISEFGEKILLESPYIHVDARYFMFLLFVIL